MLKNAAVEHLSEHRMFNDVDMAWVLARAIRFMDTHEIPDAFRDQQAKAWQDVIAAVLAAYAKRQTKALKLPNDWESAPLQLQILTYDVVLRQKPQTAVFRMPFLSPTVPQNPVALSEAIQRRADALIGNAFGDVSDFWWVAIPQDDSSFNHLVGAVAPPVTGESLLVERGEWSIAVAIEATTQGHETGRLIIYGAPHELLEESRRQYQTWREMFANVAKNREGTARILKLPAIKKGL